METPLCAVVDPVRDFRWHALRCGGPETAAFLCELPVPSWALDCTVTSMPSLTVQYMSDSGAVQLARDCGEQGTRHMSCQGKLDRDTILQQLQCSDQEVDPAQLATENNQLPVEVAAGAAEMAEQQQMSVATRRTLLPQILDHDILTVVSNNDEDNNIDVNPSQIEDTVKNVINKFNLADLMQNDQSLHSDEMDGHYDEQEKEVKKLGGKKYSSMFEKKGKFDKKGEKKVDEDEETMMGDQPDETETQPIDIVQQAMKPTEGDSDESSTSGVVGSSTEGAAASSEAIVVESTTVDSRLRRATDGETVETTEVPTTVESTTTTTTTTTTMEPTTSSTASHILPTTPKKEISAIGDHFIPPMLLVKARFTSTKAHVDTTTTTTVELLTETPEPSPSSSAAPISSTEDPTTAIMTDETYAVSDSGNDVQLVELNDKTSSPEISTSTESDVTTTHQVVEITFEDKVISSKIGTLSITTRPFTAGELQSSTAVQNATALPETASTTVVLPTTTTTTTTTTTPAPTTTSVPSTTTTPSTTLRPTTIQTVTEHELHQDDDDTDDGADDRHDSHEEEDNEADHHHEELHNSFSNIENFQPYKPNRHRSLTKPEVHNNHGNYIKKILG
ncbi:uncharacterized protein DDB_G0290587-like [Ochlerotatus camptorhynchus]